MKSPLVSINIPTLNSERVFEKVLDAVAKQTYKNIELLVIDSYSKDKTVNLAKKYGAKIIYQRGLVEQRLKGIEKSTGDYILFLDSDQVLPKDAIELMVKDMEKNKADALIIPEESVLQKNNLISKILAYHMELIEGDSGTYYATELPRFFKANKIKNIKFENLNVGYFDHVMINNELIKRNSKFARTNTRIYHHELTNWLSVIRKFYHFYGKSIIPAMKNDKKMTLGRSLPKRNYFSKKALRKPHLLLGVLFLYCLKGTALSIGLTEYLITKSFRKLT